MGCARIHLVGRPGIRPIAIAYGVVMDQTI